MLAVALLALLLAVLLSSTSPHATPTCPAGERYVAGRFTGCVPKDLSPTVSCAPGQRSVAGSVNPNGVCYP